MIPRSSSDLLRLWIRNICRCLGVYCIFHFMHWRHQNLPRSQNSWFDCSIACNFVRVYTRKCFSLTCNVVLSPRKSGHGSCVGAEEFHCVGEQCWCQVKFMGRANAQENVCPEPRSPTPEQFWCWKRPPFPIPNAWEHEIILGLRWVALPLYYSGNIHIISICM